MGNAQYTRKPARLTCIAGIALQAFSCFVICLCRQRPKVLDASLFGRLRGGLGNYSA